MKLSLLHPVVALLLACLLSTSPATAEDPPPVWILVDTQTLTLTVRSHHNKILARFRNISIGKRGSSTMRYAGDATTPLGTFHVAWENPHSPFQLFYGFDFPNPAYAKRALQLGFLGQEEHDAILHAFRNGRLPPQQTALGGYLGIHGLGDGNPDIHRNFNWTDGCIALTNAEMKRLAQWIRIGTRVVIQ